ncbi:TetR family transcriptional regulator [Chitinophaga skermanii]|uniref:TetR family transcriptional regulator n=1 Tax=Chitinophaga skermanii TaxID=331697 RepID=A0A327R2Y9_9BACT|nr:TetR/AcrR family transcriptional regulator [Chitinophaga skermanii]RAJ10428.1 TetR family transcriptional regulator [Chitinophaga skermanii]
MAEQDQKRQLILEAALKRFKRYGMAKTTMEEIAKDLEISKGSLYYYFPDKDHIYVAAIKGIVNKSFEDVIRIAAVSESMEEIMEAYISSKEKVLFDYHFLFGIHEWIHEKPSAIMRQVSDMVEKAEVCFLSTWIKRGVELGTISKTQDPERCAQLLANVMFGFWVVWCKRQTPGFDLQDRELLHTYMEMERDVMTIFFRGLA